MSELRKANTDLIYFLTFTVVGWIDVFTRKELSNIIIEKLKNSQKYYFIALPSLVTFYFRASAYLFFTHAGASVRW